VQDSITFDRSGGWSGHGGRQDEIVMRHIINQAGYLPDMYNDLANLIAPDPTYSGAAMLAMSKYGNHYIDGTSLAKDGSLFKLELVYFPTTTVGGDPQKPKLPQPDDVIGQDLHNMGDDPETYRWYLPTESKPWRSDYRQIIDVAKMFSLSGIAQETEAKRILDMDEWTRVFAAKSLSGDADTYGFGYPHNQLIYVSEGSKAVTFPWDLDFSWSRSSTDSIDPGSSIGALINSSPAFRRLYLGHLDDILKQSYNTTYMSRWTTHYGALVQQNYSGILTYIGQRAASVRSQFPFLAPFQITNNKGQNFTTNTTSLVLSGTAPFTLKELRIRGVSSSDIKWQTISNWSAAINLTNGVNSIQVIGSDFQNQVVATNTILINALLPLQDSDGDLIPDDWESAHGLDPFTPDANGDLDGDGFSNYAEYMAGTDPGNPADALHLEARSISPTQLNLQFTAKPSHSYRLQYRPGLTALWQDLIVVPSSANERIISQAQTINPLAPSLFFRVLLGPEFP